MENTQKVNQNFEAVAWGALFVLWGILAMFTTLPHGVGAVGIGLIMVGLNVARYLTGRPISGFTTTLGILALLVGGLELGSSLLHFSFELPIFPILLLALGLIVMMRARNK